MRRLLGRLGFGSGLFGALSVSRPGNAQRRFAALAMIALAISCVVSTSAHARQLTATAPVLIAPTTPPAISAAPSTAPQTIVSFDVNEARAMAVTLSDCATVADEAASFRQEARSAREGEQIALRSATDFQASADHFKRAYEGEHALAADQLAENARLRKQVRVTTVKSTLIGGAIGFGFSELVRTIFGGG